jgi:hypothetical protein
MATADFDALLGRLRTLSPDELAPVKALVERLEPREAAPRDRFRAFLGVLSADARLIARYRGLRARRSSLLASIDD